MHVRISMLWFGCSLWVLGACSALINPDETRLGDEQPIDAAVDDAGDDTRDAMADDAAVDAEIPLPDSGPSMVDAGVDAGPDCPPDCNDGVMCTVDGCDERTGECTFTPDNSFCASGERCDPTLGCIPIRCTSDADCSDGLYCNGEEVCDASAPGNGCVPGAPPFCDDGFECTNDACDEAGDTCVVIPDSARCDDGVACTFDSCEPASSSDATGCVVRADDSVCDTSYCTVGQLCQPGVGCAAGEPRDCDDINLCTVDSCSDTMAMCVNAIRDDDMDTYLRESVIDGAAEVLCGGNDCDDGNPDIYPGAPEVCNMVDDNCDGRIDEGCPVIPPDTCANASPIALDVSGFGSVVSSFARFSDDYDIVNCSNPRTGRDAIYYFDVSGIKDVTIDTIGSSGDTILGVSLSCGANGPQEACNDDYNTRVTRDSRVWLHGVGNAFVTTRVYVMVDAYDRSVTGSFRLNVQTTEAASNACGPDVFDISGGGTVLGFNNGILSNESGSCSPMPDLSTESLLSFEGESSMRASFSAYSTAFSPYTYLRSAPCASGMELDCDAPRSAGIYRTSSVSAAVRSGSDYFVFVDGGIGSYVLVYRPF